MSTHRTEAPDAARLARLFQALIRNSFDAIKVVDAQLRTIFAGPSIERLLGYTPQELLGTNPLAFVHPEDLARATAAMEAIARDGKTAQLMVRARHADGSWRHVEVVAQDLRADADIQGFVLNYRDITDRIEAEARLGVYRERCEKAFRSSPDSITISDAQTGEFLEVNNGFEQITGYTAAEVVGRRSLEMGIWKDPRLREKLTGTLRTEGHVRDFETEMVMRDGSARLCMMSAELIEIGGRPCILAITRDITKQKEAEEKLRELNETLRREQVEFVRKNVALNEVLQHMDQDKKNYRHEIAASVDNLLRPMLRKLREQGRVERREVDQLQRSLDEVTGRDIDEYKNNVSKLTPRELDILELIRAGRSSKQIAEALGLSSQTIHKHRQSIRRKLQIDHREINLATFLRSQ
jgi:PAS domain S-box-containing protein